MQRRKRFGKTRQESNKNILLIKSLTQFIVDLPRFMLVTYLIASEGKTDWLNLYSHKITASQMIAFRLELREEEEPCE
jgi:hypothetical protein